MELPKLQSEIDQFAKERNWEQFHTVKNLVLALVGEVGELAEIVQWKTDSEIETELSPAGLLARAITEPLSYGSDLKSRLEEELADVFIYLLRIASVSDIDLMRAAEIKMQLNRARYTIEKSKGNAKKQ
jgi:NTP pyrophosphatase (non-canonical NTP hydrolase)